MVEAGYIPDQQGRPICFEAALYGIDSEGEDEIEMDKDTYMMTDRYWEND